MKIVIEYNELITSLTTEKDLCHAERLLMETTRIQQQSWFDNLKNEQKSNPLHYGLNHVSPHIPKSNDTISSIPHTSPPSSEKYTHHSKQIQWYSTFEQCILNLEDLCTSLFFCTSHKN